MNGQMALRIDTQTGNQDNLIIMREIRIMQCFGPHLIILVFGMIIAAIMLHLISAKVNLVSSVVAKMIFHETNLLMIAVNSHFSKCADSIIIRHGYKFYN